MIEVPISECEVLSGRTGPILFRDKLIKIESLPEWGCSTIKCIRDQRDEDKSYHFNPQKEILANYTARKLEIFTPEIILDDVMLIDGRDSFKTKASIRPWLPGPRYQTYPKLWDFCKKIPNVCSRIDFMYILLSDFLIGFWDRYTRNLIYDRDKDIIIPIDYDDAFRFDIMTMDINGAIELFRPYMFLFTLTGIFDIDLRWFGALVNYFENTTANLYPLLTKINPALPARAKNLRFALLDFVNSYKIGAKIDQDKKADITEQLEGLAK